VSGSKARVSTEDQAKHGYSLPWQLEACHKYAGERGWTVVAEVQDDGVSGLGLDRPGLDEIRQLAEAAKVDGVVVYDLDRRRKADIERELERIDREIEELRNELPGEVTFAQKEAIEEFASRVAVGIEALSLEEKRAVLRLLELRGHVHFENDRPLIRLTGLFRDTGVGLLPDTSSCPGGHPH